MKQSEIFYLVAQCLPPDATSGFWPKIISAFQEERLLDDFIIISSNELVLPGIYLNFKKHGVMDGLPDELTEIMQNIYELNKKRNTEIIQQVTGISQTFAFQQIEPLYLKGAANLIDGLYNDIGERMIGDIDVLVKEHDYLAAAELLMDQGYKYDQKVYDDVTTMKHFPRLFKNDVPVNVEIHRIPVTEKHSKHFNSAIVFDKKKVVPLIENCFVPCDEHKAILNFIHDQLSNYGYTLRQTSLRNLYDMHLISRRLATNQNITATGYEKKSSVYYHFTETAFSIPGVAVTLENKPAVRYRKQHDWLLSHPRAHTTLFLLMRFYQLVFTWFLFKTCDLFFNKSFRKGVLLRLKDPDWYYRSGHLIKSWFYRYILGR